jgi:hypothetical protein
VDAIILSIWQRGQYAGLFVGQAVRIMEMVNNAQSSPCGENMPPLSVPGPLIPSNMDYSANTFQKIKVQRAKSS